MKVVVGVDHSPHSEEALRWVRGAAWPADTRFILVSAVPLEAATYAYAFPAGLAGFETVQEERLRAHRDLTLEAERSLRSGHLTVESRVELGDPRELIVRTAEAEGAGLIVVGSHGRTGLPLLLMGSVAGHVVSHAPCNVMVIKLPKSRLPR